MRPYLPIVHSVLIIGLILSVVFLFRTNERLERKLKSHHHSSSVKIHNSVSNSSQENSDALILTFLGVGFGLFSFITFQGVYSISESKISEIRKEYKRAEENYKAYEHRMNLLENGLTYQLAELLDDRASKLREGNSSTEYIATALVVCEKYSIVLSNSQHENQMFIDSVKRRISVILKEIHFVSHLSTINKNYPMDTNLERFKKLIENISKHLEEEELQQLNEIASRIRVTQK